MSAIRITEEHHFDESVPLLFAIFEQDFFVPSLFLEEESKVEMNG